MKEIYVYPNTAKVRAIRFSGDNANEVIEFGTYPKGSRPKVWRSPWPNAEDALSYVVDDVSATFAPLRVGEWLIIKQDSTMQACPDDDFRQRYSRVEAGR